MPDRRPSGGLRHSLSRQTSCCPGPGQAVRRAGCPHPACPRPRALLARALRPPGPGPRFSSKLGGGLLATGSPLPPSPVSALPRAADEPEHPEGLTWSGEGTGVGARPCPQHVSGGCGSLPHTSPPAPAPSCSLPGMEAAVRSAPAHREAGLAAGAPPPAPGARTRGLVLCSRNTASLLSHRPQLPSCLWYRQASLCTGGGFS